MKRKSVTDKKPFYGLDVMIAGEDLIRDITLSTFCVKCLTDPPKYHLVDKGNNNYETVWDDEEHDQRAYYIYEGNGICERHMKMIIKDRVKKAYEQ